MGAACIVVTRRAETQISYRQGLLRLGDFLLPSHEETISLHCKPSPIQCWPFIGAGTSVCWTGSWRSHISRRTSPERIILLMMKLGQYCRAVYDVPPSDKCMCTHYLTTIERSWQYNYFGLLDTGYKNREALSSAIYC